MTREEQIEKAGKECYNKYSHYYAYNDEDAIITTFEYGAKWADEHPINVWHNSSEEPQGDSEILFDGVGYSIIYGIESDLDKSGIDWKELVKDHCIQRWAYISDLLPKGGK